jgi:chromosome segregation ATPase
MNEDRILNKLDAIDDRITRQGESLARLEERLKSYGAQLDNHEREDEAMRRKLDDLVKWKWSALGAIGLFTFASQFLIRIFNKQ